MKYFSGLIFALLLSLIVISCSGGGGGGDTGAGGPDISPADSAEQAIDVPAEDATVVTAAAPEKDTQGVDQLEDLADDSSTTTPADSVIGGGSIEGQKETDKQDDSAAIESISAEQEALDVDEDEEIAAEVDEAEQVADTSDGQGQGKGKDGEKGKGKDTGFSYALDISAGRWFQTPQGKAGNVNPADYNRKADTIKDLRAKIRDLRKSMKDGDKSEVRAEIRDLMKQIQNIRNQIGYGTEQKGIHTYWANENLYLRIHNVPKAGLYRVRVVAKNYGALPEFYDYFNITVNNDTLGKNVGGIFIKASESSYNRGSSLVYLQKGDTDLNLLWTNDAYKEKEYDANIQISNVSLEQFSGERKMSKLVRRSHQFSEVQGRFFWDRNSVTTYWSDQTIGFNFPDLQPGKYRVIVTAKNYGTLPLPPNYREFEVSVDADGTSGLAKIPASANNWERGFAVLDLTGGNTDIYLTWMNDKYRENEYDANIQIKTIRLQRIGNSERSALAAYLLGATGRNKSIVAGGFAFLMMAIAVLVLWNRRRTRLQI